jgi:recombinational DNA repair ATPase RecF
MKIRKIKWSNHPILGNLELDLTNSITGLPYDTIILAGENGTGKSTILEDVSTFLNMGSFEYFEYIEYTVNGDTYKAIQQTGNKLKESFTIDDGSGNLSHIRTNTSDYRAVSILTIETQDITDVYFQGQGLIIKPTR